MRKRITITQPGEPPPDPFTDDTRNPFEPDASLLVPGAYVVVEIWSARLNRFVEVLNLTIPEAQQ